MAVDLSRQSFPITCANCGNNLHQTLGWLKDHLEFPCPKCGATIRADCGGSGFLDSGIS
jgi:predicted RNA-binding Zn-ribbon protein involved in translation (DUF1610 family)